MEAKPPDRNNLQFNRLAFFLLLPGAGGTFALYSLVCQAAHLGAAKHSTDSMAEKDWRQAHIRPTRLGLKAATRVRGM